LVVCACTDLLGVFVPPEAAYLLTLQPSRLLSPFRLEAL
jgi:hypothetical protein